MEKKIKNTTIREIIEGSFVENKKVKVNVDGNIIERKVYYSKHIGDLYVLYKGNMYFYSEFTTEK